MHPQITRIKKLENLYNQSNFDEDRRKILRTMFQAFDRGEKPSDEFFRKNKLQHFKETFFTDQVTQII